MSKLRVHNFSISLDGYGAGPNQGLKEPLGENGEALHEWMFPTRTFKTLYGDGNGTTGTNDDFVKRGFENLGAWILGRNMFGPIRGTWPDDACAPASSMKCTLPFLRSFWVPENTSSTTSICARSATTLPSTSRAAT